MEERENNGCCVTEIPKQDQAENWSRKIWNLAKTDVEYGFRTEIDYLKKKLQESKVLSNCYMHENRELKDRIQTMQSNLDYRQRLNEDLAKLVDEANYKLASYEKKKDNLDFLDGQIQELEGILSKYRQYLMKLEGPCEDPSKRTSAYDLSKVGKITGRNRT